MEKHPSRDSLGASVYASTQNPPLASPGHQHTGTPSSKTTTEPQEKPHETQVAFKSTPGSASLSTEVLPLAHLRWLA